MRIAPDIDSRMWDIANTRDVTAAENFSKMFPDLASELSKRMLLVQDLRRAKDLHVKHVPVPAFRPVQNAPKFSTGQRAVAGAILLGAAALAFGAYVWVAQNRTPVNNPASVANSDLCTHTAAPRSRPAVVQGGFRTRVVHNYRPPFSPLDSRRQVSNNLNESQSAAVPPVLQRKSADRKPMTIALTQVPLSAALEAISTQTGLNIEQAPNMANPTIDAKYDQTDALSVLRDLGSKYGFDVLQDGENKVLLLPKASVSGSQN